MVAILKRIYLFLESLPDRMYPFTSEIEGQLVRGRRSYKHAVDRAWEKYGPHRLGYKLTIYRSVFHFLGSVLFIVFAALLSQKFFESDTALYVLLSAAIAALFIQEFYLQPQRLGQQNMKGVTDWLTWVLPMMLYLLLR